MTKFKLSYRKSERRWRKKYKGKTYNFPLREGETKESSYQRVLLLWLQKKAEIDSAAAEDKDASVRESWQPLPNEVRAAQQRLIDTYGDTDETRLVWGDLDQFFVQQVIVPASLFGP